MQRLDLLLVELGHAKTRTHAQRLIKNGQVRLQTPKGLEVLAKPGLKLTSDSPLDIELAEVDRYVSRGALKLLGALEQFSIDVTGLTAIDVGQSTGGFTDCLLQGGASKVVGIEVGHDQLDASLKDDPRVICLEGMNARTLPANLVSHTPDQAGFDLAVMDVSFISQTKILPSLTPLLKRDGMLITLVKPQFEVGKDGIGKGGIVKDSSLFESVKQSITFCCEQNDLSVLGYTESPIKGGDGNREFLLWAKKV
jgi:23S rRNA (cytidine1920-2'-O)/16S rRNA (cytidine1409-2'-O)-methyltransferase